MSDVFGHGGCTRREFLALAGVAGGLALAGCAGDGGGEPAATTEAAGSEAREQGPEPTGLEIDMGRWSYDEDNDVYYQLQVPYCLDPVSELYETLAVYVPGAYFDAEEHGQVYSCSVREDGARGAYTAATAPILVPVNAGDFAAQQSPASYDPEGLGDYLDAGLVYVYPGLRGRSSAYESSTDTFIVGGAPWALVDLKAVVRFLRLNAGRIPGSAERVCVAGHGAGGALSVLAGATGDSPLFDAYLDEVGAARRDGEGRRVSDAIFASASWCPVIPTDDANAAYEWAMGQYDAQGTRVEGTFTRQLSTDLAEAWGAHLNGLGLVDADGRRLELNETAGAVFSSGSYYDHLLAVAEESFAGLVATSSSPIAVDRTARLSAGFPGGGTTGAASQAEAPESEDAREYGSLAEYLDELNADYHWLDYDEADGVAQVASLSALAAHCRPATRDVCAFDSLTRDQSTNQLFGVEEAESLHYDATVATLLDDNQESYAQLSNWDAGLPEEWRADLALRDSLDVGMAARRDMYDPLYHLSGANDGFGLAEVAPHWRINTGLQQDATTLVQEVDLAACLRAYDGVEDCELTVVWNRGFDMAERSGDPVANLLAWIESCCGAAEGREES